MITSSEELDILRELNDKHLMMRSDLVKSFSKKNSNFSISSVDRLVERGFVKRLSGITIETSYAITQTGIKFLNKK